MKNPIIQMKDKPVEQRKILGRPPDASRNESGGTSSSDPSFFSCLEKIHQYGMEFYMNQEDPTCMPLKDLCKKMDNWNFSPGVLKDNIYAVKQTLSVSHFCSVSVDKIPIEPVIQFDSVSEVFTGFVAPLCSEIKLANEVIVFVIRGFEVEWKCLAGYMSVNLQEDGWAIWHILNQLIILLAQYDFTVVNVVFGEGIGFDILDNADENVIKGDSLIQHPYYQRDILCFSKSVDDLVKSVTECIIQENFTIPDEILTKYELAENVLRPDHLQALIGCENWSLELVTTWLFQKDREFPEEDRMPDLKTEIFILRMLWMWVNAMTFVLDDDTSGFYSVETHIQTLHDTSSIFGVLEKDVTSTGSEVLWNSMRRSTLSCLALYEHYVAKGIISGIRYNSFRSVSLHHLKGLVQCNDLSSPKPKPCNVLQFLHLVNSAVMLHSNFADKDFESGIFFSEFLEHRRVFQPCDVEECEDLSDLDGLGLYYLSSRVVTKLVHQNQCETCKAALVAEHSDKSVPPVWLEAVDRSSLFRPSMSVYDTLQWAESQFVHTDEDILRLHKPCTQFAYRVYGEISFGIRSAFPSCHDVLRGMLGAFMSVRLKMVAEDITRRLK